MWPFKRSRARSHSSLRVASKSGVMSANDRVDFYNELHLHLKNSTKLDIALTDMYEVYSDDGKRPRRKMALIIKEILSGMARGYSFSQSFGPYTPEGEFFLISAGEKSSYLKESMQAAIHLIKCKARLVAAFKKAFVYNIFLALMMAGVLVVSSFWLIPKSMIMIKPEQLTGFAYATYALSQFVVNFGLYTVAAIIGMVFLIRWAQPNYIGRRRIFLDKFWPFTVYRTVAGSTFLLSLSSLLKANVQTGDALAELAEHASPYIKQRVMAALSGMQHGHGLGMALHVSGYNFPDKRAIRHLRILGSKSGIEIALARFADDWLEETIKQADAHADVAKNVGMILIFLLAGVVIVGTAMIQQASLSAMGAF